MNDEQITILPDFSPNPEKFRAFTVIFFAVSIAATVTATPSVVRSWLFKVLRLHHFRRDTLVIGLGVQWNHAHPMNRPPPATLQLCIGRHCLIFQILHANHVPLCLRRFLADRRNTFVGVRNFHDQAMLLRSEHRVSVARLVDARLVAAEREGLSPQLSMERLAERILGTEDVKKPKSVGLSAWDAYWLSSEQVQYACVDAYVSFELGRKLNAWNWEDS